MISFRLLKTDELLSYLNVKKYSTDLDAFS